MSLMDDLAAMFAPVNVPEDAITAQRFAAKTGTCTESARRRLESLVASGQLVRDIVFANTSRGPRYTTIYRKATPTSKSRQEQHGSS